MSGFDWIIAAIFLISILVGILRGFIKEVLSLTSWILAFWLGNRYCQEAGEFLSGFINIPADAFRVAAGFALVFIGTLFLFAIISYIISKVFVHGAIKGTDRALGVVSGAVRAGAIVVAIMLVARGLGFENNQWWAQSQLLPHFLPTANYIEPLLPKKLQSSNKEEESLETKVIKKALENIDIPNENTKADSASEN